jgi:hypothetical protein
VRYARSVRFALAALLFALPAAALADETEDYDPDLPLEAQRESEEARSANRITFQAHFGLIADPGTSSPGNGSNLGPSFAFSKPFYMGTRRRFNQFLVEARVGAGWVPNRFVLLQMSPMWGSNFYFGPYVGLESRMGFFFASKLSSSVTQFGLSGQLETAIVLRVFHDDRMRLKAIGGVGIQFWFGQAVGGLSAYLGAGFETAL